MVFYPVQNELGTMITPNSMVSKLEYEYAIIVNVAYMVHAEVLPARSQSIISLVDR